MTDLAPSIFRQAILVTILAFVAGGLRTEGAGATRPGYYRYPAIHDDIVIFSAGGDLWRASAIGGAERLHTAEGYACATIPGALERAAAAEWLLNRRTI